jgi:hypothetical protein
MDPLAELNMFNVMLHFKHMTSLGDLDMEQLNRNYELAFISHHPRLSPSQILRLAGLRKVDVSTRVHLRIRQDKNIKNISHSRTAHSIYRLSSIDL